MKKIRQFTEYIALRIIIVVFKILPLAIVYWFARRLADFVFYVLRIRREVTLNNLRQAFKNEKSEQELIKIARKAYQNFILTSVEILLSQKLNLDDVKKTVRLENKEVFENALKKNKGIVIISGHIGNWELLGAAFSAYGFPTSFVIGEQSNVWVDKLYNHSREIKQIKLIPKKYSLRGVLKTLKNNELVCLLSDQDAGAGGVFVKFFDKIASTPQGAAMFALKTGASLVACADIPSNDRKHHRGILKLIDIKITGDEEKDVFSYTQAFTKEIENIIRQYPEHYFWLHRRWKTRPLGEIN